MDPKSNSPLDRLLDEVMQRANRDPRIRLTQKLTREVLSEFFEVVSEKALAGEEVRLPKFGTFLRRERKATKVFGREAGASYYLAFRAASRRKGKVPPIAPKEEAHGDAA